MEKSKFSEIADKLPNTIDMYPNRKNFSVPGTYAICHPNSGKAYVGSTGNLYTRISQHRRNLIDGRHRNVDLQNAYDSDPNFDLVFRTTNDRKEAYVIEQDLLDELMRKDGLFNRSQDAIVANRGSSLSEDRKLEIRESTMAQFSTEESRYRHSEIIRRKWQDPEYRAKHMGHDVKDQTKQIISSKLKELWQDPEYRERMQRNRGKPITIDGVEYPSFLAASRQLNIPESTLRYRLNKLKSKEERHNG